MVLSPPAARFAPGIVRSDFKGHFGAIFNPILFGCDVVIFFGQRAAYTQVLRIPHLTKWHEKRGVK
jgi:hypothetical protein